MLSLLCSLELSTLYYVKKVKQREQKQEVQIKRRCQKQGIANDKKRRIWKEPLSNKMQLSVKPNQTIYRRRQMNYELWATTKYCFQTLYHSPFLSFALLSFYTFFWFSLLLFDPFVVKFHSFICLFLLFAFFCHSLCLVNCVLVICLFCHSHYLPFTFSLFDTSFDCNYCHSLMSRS